MTYVVSEHIDELVCSLYADNTNDELNELLRQHGVEVSHRDVLKIRRVYGLKKSAESRRRQHALPESAARRKLKALESVALSRTH